MDQTIINWFFGSIGLLAGGIIKAMWDAVKDLQNADRDLVEKVSALDKVVAGEYVKRDHFDSVFERLTEAIFKKLDKIQDKLDGKADR